MKWKNILKIFLISGSISAIVLIGTLIWGLSKLPSAFDIKQNLTPPALKDHAAKVSTESDEQVLPPSSEQGDASAHQENPPALSEKEQITKNTTRVLLEDFLDTRKPLVEGCRNLERASQSHFFRDPQNASAKYFFEILAGETKDPLVETAAPVMRFMFRAPGMQSVVDMVMKSEEEKDPGLLKKAEFYYEIYRAGEYLKNHKSDIDMILQKTYNMHHLAKAVAQKPDLAKDSATLSFCEQMEKNVNENGSYDAEEAAAEMLKFLADAGVDPKSIGYDPKYRSQVKMNLSSTQLNINDAWVVRLFARDIEKAHKESAKN
ncbi:MAG: hypothetical protein KUL82_08395 [Bdellovibrio sp.]|nr:hypothetical protein [Bdellovibrio sp.]